MAKSEPEIYRLLVKLRTMGGALVSSDTCTAEEILLAKSNDRYTLDADGFGYVWRPPTTITQTKLKAFKVPRPDKKV